MKHKHADVIKAWADGAPCQWRRPHWDFWMDLQPASNVNDEYRIKRSESFADEQTDDHTGICMEVEA